METCRLYVLYVQKGASEAPRTHSRACKISKFSGDVPPDPPCNLYYRPHFLYLTWAPPILSRQPCLPPEEEIPCLRTSSCRPTHFHQVLQVGSWVHPETVCPLVWDSKETMYCFTRFRCNSSVFLCELWLTKECQFGSHYYRTAILGYLNSEYSHRICLWIQNCILTIDSLSASTFSSDCVGWSLSSSMYS